VEKSYRSEIAQTIKAHTTPLQAICSTLQEQLHINEQASQKMSSGLSDKLRDVENRVVGIQDNYSVQSMSFKRDVESTVDRMLRDKHLIGNMDQLSLDISLSKHNEFVLQVNYCL